MYMSDGARRTNDIQWLIGGQVFLMILYLGTAVRSHYANDHRGHHRSGCHCQKDAVPDPMLLLRLTLVLGLGELK